MADIHARTPFKPAHLQRLAASSVAILALGSVGSPVALMLARAGVERFILADPAHLKVANVSRHEGNLFGVGQPKTDLVAGRLWGINPAIEIKPCRTNIFDWPDDRLTALLASASIMVASTDIGAVQQLANFWSYRLGIPTVFAGCYEGARGGEVFCTLPGTDAPCYACLRAGLQSPRRQTQVDYSHARRDQDFEGEPGLYAAVNQVANAAAQAALSLLLKDEPDSQLGQLIQPKIRQLLLVGNATSDGFYRFRRPFDTYFQPLSGKRHDCPVCSGNHEAPPSAEQPGDET